MHTQLISNTSFRSFAQISDPYVYGGSDYGAHVYSCDPTIRNCTTQEPGAPNTGFLGLSKDSTPLAVSGSVILLGVIIAVAVFLVIRSRKKKGTQE